MEILEDVVKELEEDLASCRKAYIKHFKIPKSLTASYYEGKIDSYEQMLRFLDKYKKREKKY